MQERVARPTKLFNVQALRGVAALFVAASHLAVTERKLGGKLLLPDFILSGCMILLLGHGFYATLIGDGRPSGWWRVLISGSSSGIVLYCVILLEENGKSAPRWLVTLGDASYSIYLSHVLVLSAMGRIWLWLLPASHQGIADNLIAVPILFAGVIGAALVSYFMIETHLVKLCTLTRFARPPAGGVGPSTIANPTSILGRLLGPHLTRTDRLSR
jgi:peptidoglycan/LPS O-acetylase OafA/YrhL